MNEPVERFRNGSPDSTQIFIELSLAASEMSSFYKIGGLLMPRPGRWQEDWFQLDTGAQGSAISGGLALELGLDLSGPLITVETVRGEMLALETFFRVNIGNEWVRLPCWVPWPVEPARSSGENLLGLGGLLDKYDILLTREHVTFFQRGASGRRTGNIDNPVDYM